MTNKSRASELYVQYRLELIMAMGGECSVCGWNGEKNPELLELHHTQPKERVWGGKNYYVMKQIWQWHRTKIIPSNVMLLCPNHHKIADRNRKLLL